MTRTMLSGTSMGEMIPETYSGIYQMINDSSKKNEKLQELWYEFYTSII